MRGVLEDCGTLSKRLDLADAGRSRPVAPANGTVELSNAGFSTPWPGINFVCHVLRRIARRPFCCVVAANRIGPAPPWLRTGVSCTHSLSPLTPANSALTSGFRLG